MIWLNSTSKRPGKLGTAEGGPASMPRMAGASCSIIRGRLRPVPDSIALEGKGETMTHTSRKLGAVFAVTLAVLVTVLASPVAWAQASGMSAKPLLRTSLSDDTSKDTVMLAVEIAAGGTTGRHFHHGDEYAFVLQGTLELVAEGRETRRVTVGDAFHNPRGLIHEAKNAGDTPVRLHIVFVVDKGKPIIESVAK
ncbi:MAG: cupin domain-containing protein [Betaproteobacteria bacterium]|nr:cupin domain-containing protein [Betaproteobacteria bacterium]